MSAVTTSLPRPVVYYNNATGKYVRQDTRGVWIGLSESSVRRHLKEAGFNDRRGFGLLTSELDSEITRVQLEHTVDGAMALAGYDQGIHEINGRRILVTESPTLIIPAPGNWPTIAAILERMFIAGGIDQRPYLFGWLHVACSALRARQWQPGQVCVFAGPVESGKSLLQWIITQLLGGRSANPFLYMTDRTSFNADHFRAEHLAIEDSAESTDMRTRRHAGAFFKAVSVNREHNFHQKGATAMTLTPFWRLTVSVNDEPGRLQVVPPIEDDIADKIMLFQVSPGAMPMPTTTTDQKQQFEQTLRSELPAFLDFILNHSIPPELTNSRCGIRHYHHPELLANLSLLSSETRLLDLIDGVVFEREARREWVGRAAELERELLTASSPAYVRQAERLLHYSSACGVYLSNLARVRPERVQQTSRGVYRIEAPRFDLEEVLSAARSEGAGVFAIS